MAKYYIKILTEDNQTFEQIVNADNEMQACIVTWERLRIVPKGTSWKVGELGFDVHDDDIYFGGAEVAAALAKHRKKKK